MTVTTPPDALLGARLHGAARQMLRDRRPAEALPVLDRLARLPGLAPAAALMQAEALAALERLPEAEAAADRALAADPEWSAARQVRARIRLARGERKGAIDDAAAAVMATPWDPGAKALLGTAMLEERCFDEAIWFLGEAVQAEPADAGLRARFGQAFMLAGRHEAAAEQFETCRQQAPDRPRFAALQAQNALLAGNAAAAIACAEAGLAQGIPDASLHSILAHALVDSGRLDEAAPHFTKAARLSPGNGYLAHLAAAATGQDTERATDGYVAALFDGYAARFESSLLGLGYRVPGLVRRSAERHWPAVAAGQAKLGPVLDLGCGTGLVGVALADLLGGPLTGIDLSRGMLEQAAAKQIYASLRQGDIATILGEGLPAQALIVAADVFIYLGRLDEVLRLCRTVLAPDGALIFSLELLAPGGGDWRLGPSGRYAHAEDYILRCLDAAGLVVVEQRAEALRLETQHPVQGLMIRACPAAG